MWGFHLGLLFLLPIFEIFPLFTKKKRDYLLWTLIPLTASFFYLRIQLPFQYLGLRLTYFEKAHLLIGLKWDTLSFTFSYLTAVLAVLIEKIGRTEGKETFSSRNLILFYLLAQFFFLGQHWLLTFLILFWFHFFFSARATMKYQK